MPFSFHILWCAVIWGKSTGKGALSLWTHNLNAIEPLLNYSSRAYRGAALRKGGVLSGAAYAAAHRLGYRIVGGACPMVRLAGGFSLGGGMYAVVVAMTARMHRDDDAPTAGALLSVNLTALASSSSSTSSSSSSSQAADAVYDAMDLAHGRLAPLVDSGAYQFTSFTQASVALAITAPGQLLSRLRCHLQPVVDHLARHGVAYTLNYTQLASYFSHFDRFYGPLPAGQYAGGDLVTSGFVPRDFMRAPAVHAALELALIYAGWDWRLGPGASANAARSGDGGRCRASAASAAAAVGAGRAARVVRAESGAAARRQAAV